MANGDLFELVVFVIVGTFAVGRILGLNTTIEKMGFVRQRPTLKHLLG